jgi:hypothetical protein
MASSCGAAGWTTPLSAPTRSGTNFRGYKTLFFKKKSSYQENYYKDLVVKIAESMENIHKDLDPQFSAPFLPIRDKIKKSLTGGEA